MAAVLVSSEPLSLYVGGLASLSAGNELSLNRRVLSLGSPPAPCAGAVDFLPLELADEEEADLLALLPACLAFANSSRAPLLVACHAGVSRSCAVATALLMHWRALDAEQALALLRVSHAEADPNAGFQRQLRLWGEMGCQLSESHAGYRRHRVLQHALHAASALASPPLTSEPSEGRVGGTVRCRKCRRLLAVSEHVVRHEHGSLAVFGPAKMSALDRSASAPCSSLFLEPMAWMAPELVDGALSGKLACPGARCGARLGAWSWAGERCSCGAWVTPAFQIHAGRVDVAAA